jgi:cysteine-rich CPXCG protein
MLRSFEDTLERFPAMSESDSQEDFVVSCPYCGEDVEIHVELDVAGTLVQDCEVCCNPWLLRVTGDGGNRSVSVTRADGSE